MNRIAEPRATIWRHAPLPTRTAASLLTPAVVERIVEHAREDAPHECCGVIQRGRYIPLPNTSPDPTRAFAIDFLDLPKEFDAVVHSHPDGTRGASALDIAQQAAMGVPWVLCVLRSNGRSEVFAWGDQLAREPLIGRAFRHGTTDCYGLIRDWYWIERGIVLPDFPRDDSWWDHGQDLYVQGFARAGFHHAAGEPQVGDVLLFQMGAPVIQHGGVVVEGGMMLHHLVGRLSGREPWMAHAGSLRMVLRHASAEGC
jgi:cell wall-associated NlpC family hydrolase